MISVIVPVYGVEKYLDDCITSIIEQTYKDIEIILVDDGSVDNSGAICDKYAACDDRIIVIHKENGGVGSARNTGLNIAKGEYIAFMDGDDIYPPDALEYLYKAIVQSDCLFAIGREHVFEDGTGINPDAEPLEERIISEYEFWQLRDKNMRCVCPTTKLYSRKILENVRFGRFKNHEDQAVLWEIVSQCDKIFYSNKIVYYYRKHEGSATTSAYGIKNMALSEALLGEIEYFKRKGYTDLALYSFGKGTRTLIEGCEILSLKNDEVRWYVYDQYIKYKEIARYLIKRQRGFKVKLRLLLFCMNFKLYANLQKLF